MSNNQIKKKNLLIICRGAGDLATGIIHRLHRAGHRVIALETDYPAAIRRQVSFCEAVYDGSEKQAARLVLTSRAAMLMGEGKKAALVLHYICPIMEFV